MDTQSNTNTKHTPTPWKCEEAYGGSELMIFGQDKYIASVRIHQTPRSLGTYDEDRRAANAAFIVRACNAHDEAIALIDELQNAAFEYAHPETIKRARAWLAKAGRI